MYAVIATGGKQYQVREGQRLDVERLAAGDAEVVFAPVLVVDGENVASTPERLNGASVRVRVLGETKGPKINGFTYKSKTNSRRRYGHRQKYSTIEVVAISIG
ncbi:MAG: 50S ribosomal protein L21 [Acidimicrobiia bacterium]